MRKRQNFVPVNTLGDLTLLVNRNCHIIDKRITRLSRRSHKLTILAVAAIGYSVWAEAERRKQEEQIYQLTIRVKKLERGEGE